MAEVKPALPCLGHGDFKLALRRNQDRAEALSCVLIKQIAALRAEIDALIARYAWV